MTRKEMQQRRRAALLRRFGGDFRVAADDFDLDELLGAEEVLEDEFGDDFDPEALPVLDDETGMIDEETGECVCKDEEPEGDESEEKEEDEDEDEGEGEGEGEKEASVEESDGSELEEDEEPEMTETSTEPETTEASTEPETTEASTEPERLWAPLLNEAALDEMEGRDVTMIYNASNEEDPFYAMVVGGQPLCSIHAADLNMDPQALPMFSTEVFTNGVQSHIASQGLKKTLAGLNPRYYAARTTKTAEADRAKGEVQADYEKAYQSRVAETKNRIMNLFALAFEAGRKNFIVENPLRDAMRIAFRKVGVNDAQAVELFEAAMEQAGPAFLQNAQRHVDEWLGMEPEALDQLKKAITGAAYASPTDRGLRLIPEQIPEAPASLPTPQPQVPRYQASAQPTGDTSWDADEALVRGVLGTMTKPRS